MTDVLMRKQRFGHRTQRHRGDARRTPPEGGGRDCSDVSVCQGTPRIAGNHQKLGRGKEGFFPGVFRECMALRIL